MFFLDVSPTEAAVRIAENRTKTEMFESLEALRKVRWKALSLTRFDEWTIIDSNKSVNEVASALRKNMFGE
jgi:dTMP kinase